MIFVVLGPDRSLARTHLKKLISEHDPHNQNTSVFDANADPVDAVLNAVATPSFFGGARVVVATGYLPKKTSASSASTPTRGKVAKAGKGQPSGSALESIIEIASGTQILILHEPELGAVPVTVKSMLPASTTVSVNQPPRGQQLVELTRTAFSERGTSVERDVVRYFLDKLFPGHWQQAERNPAFDQPPDIDRLINEIEKLSLAAGQDEITEELIDQLTPESGAERRFPFLDAVFAGNAANGLRELETLAPADDERARVLAMLLQQVEYAVAAAQSGRPSDPLQAGKALGMSNPNRMKSVLRSLGSPGVPLSHLMTAALDADRRLKRGLDIGPDEALFRLIDSAGTARRS